MDTQLLTLSKILTERLFRIPVFSDRVAPLSLEELEGLYR
jgi:hypothetical protein